MLAFEPFNDSRLLRFLLILPAQILQNPDFGIFVTGNPVRFDDSDILMTVARIHLNAAHENTSSMLITLYHKYFINTISNNKKLLQTFIYLCVQKFCGLLSVKLRGGRCTHPTLGD
jgi:hypothetical protein